MKVTKIWWRKYKIEQNGQQAIVKFCCFGRRDLFFSKYHPTWLLIYNNKTFTYANKEDAFQMAEKLIGK